MPENVLQIYNALTISTQADSGGSGGPSQPSSGMADSDRCVVCQTLSGFQCPGCALWLHPHCARELVHDASHRQSTSEGIEGEEIYELGVSLANLYKQISGDTHGHMLRSFCEFDSLEEMRPCRGELKLLQSCCDLCQAALGVVQSADQTVFDAV